MKPILIKMQLAKLNITGQVLPEQIMAQFSIKKVGKIAQMC